MTSLEKGGYVTVRSLGTVWSLFDKPSLDAFKSWIQNHAAFMAQFTYSALALPGWSVPGSICPSKPNGTRPTSWPGTARCLRHLSSGERRPVAN